jgi:hypothetical protein
MAIIKMKTRSQSRIEYDINIDFDEASRLWNSNKKKLDNGCYVYVCGKELAHGMFCKKKSLKHQPFCYMHKCKN